MKYFGSVYLGNIDVYDTQELRECDNPYQALLMANCDWDGDPNKQIRRLLIVLRKNDESDKIIIEDKAYFQFTDSNACKVFVDNKNEIKWSTSGCQVWNGNAKMM